MTVPPSLSFNHLRTDLDIVNILLNQNLPC